MTRLPPPAPCPRPAPPSPTRRSTSCADDKCHFCKDISDLLMYKGPERAKVCLEEDCCELCACNCGASGKPFKFKNPAACVAFAAEQREADKVRAAV